MNQSSGNGDQEASGPRGQETALKSNQPVILETQALTRHFGKMTAVDAIDLSVHAGEAFGLLGPNGAGKSTVIKMLTTLLPPSAGQAQIAGFDVVRQSSRVQRVIGYVPQALSADGTLTGYENLLIFAKLYDLPRRGREAKIRDALAFMGLTEAANQLVRTYSGGMIRRLEIAQSVLHHPQLLFLDEPTVGLDPRARSSVWQLVRQLQQDYGTTVFLTTHFMEEADSLCDRVAIMHRGSVVVTGSPTELKASLDKPDATLDDVFIHYTGDQLTSGGTYRDTSKLRRTAQRLG
ncbi:ATP-binding cassette domain-containing protein [Leptolyngbya sp. FACHB-261]|uniref:ATP-binding cassette domain-containing protein n=1 Tax=Leptolyngbya sp. FACHB-261 TaxID=2692806 RepID=UPI0016842F9B|nr:ATP-binding cassette domain-containing protein [Leptolyngbya sp. FACHB-261]MBD2101647.1 ATP-binding cassette domain-containing protein [Leptolyngbya sp. FACHB-261]